MSLRDTSVVGEIASWLRHVDRLDEIPGARCGLPDLNPLWDASFAIEREFSSSRPARPEPDALVRQGPFGYPSPEGQKKREAIARRHAERDIRRESRRRRWRCFWSWPWGHRYETPDGRGTTEVFATASSGGARPDLRCVGCGRGFGVGNA